MEGDRQGVELKFEEDAGGAAVMFDLARVVGHAVLVSAQRLGAGRDVGCGDNVEEVLVCDEVFVGDFE